VQRKAEARHAILVSVGTDGDVYPFLSLGMTLRSRGHRVTLATHEHFSGLATENDLEFRALVSNAETEELLEKPDFWHPYKGPMVAAKWGRRFIHRQHEVLRELVAGERVQLIASPGVVAARVIQEQFGTPLASIVLQPWMIPSVHAPPTMMGGLTFPRWAAPFGGDTYLWLFNRVGALLVGRRLEELRRSLGLKPIRRFFHWWLSPSLVVGMFPEWFASPQPDWPSQMKLAGFPVNDGKPTADLPLEIRQFCEAGKPPVAFTFGTGMMHAAELFREGMEACQSLEVRGILLTKFRSQLPAQLPASVIYCGFAPFQKLFPRCAAVVHHGGIGTTAKALAAGVPQLILPFAFDQMDNANRVRKLGCGDWLKPKQRNAIQLARGIATVITSKVATQARAIAGRFNGNDGLKTAADFLESL
jgi:rhamnosyltransferase subunit B